MSGESGLVAERLEEFRRKLIDTGRRNRLVNFRTHTAKGNKPLDKVLAMYHADPTQLLTKLVLDKRALRFRAALEERRKPEGESEELLFDDGDVAADESPADSLLCRVSPSRLERQLTKIRRDQIAMIEETGVNALFLALGTVEWFEADASQEKRLAPLILVPVSLERTANGHFRLKWDGTDIGGNLSFAALLKEEFGLQLPNVEGEEMDLTSYFDQVQATIEKHPAWRLDRGATNLGFFSFAKYLMYHDLAIGSWPQDRPILDHGQLGALFVSGFGSGDEALSDEADLDELRPIGETCEVFDADGSQTLAILQALQGHSMIIEGPPGTGKSQTIANLIAEFIGQGKRVLFVSEKNAALNVVHGRLKAAGLEGACLELHGLKANKRAFYERLRETVERAAPPLADSDAQLRTLREQRTSLNEYVRELYRPLEGRGITPREAIARLVRLGTEEDTDGRMKVEAMTGWTASDFEDALQVVVALQRQLLRITSPKEHPFFGTSETYISPDDKADLAREIGSTRIALGHLRSVGSDLAERLRVNEPCSLSDVRRLIAISEYAVRAPDCAGMNLTSPSWLINPGGILHALEYGRRIEELSLRLQPRFLDNALDRDTTHVWEQLAAPGGVQIPPTAEGVWRALDKAETAVIKVVDLAAQASAALCLEAPKALWNMKRHADTAARIGGAPDMRGVDFKSSDWLRDANRLTDGLMLVKRRAELHARLDSTVKPEAWSSPAGQMMEVIERERRSFLRRTFGPEFRSTRKRASELAVSAPSTIDETLDLLRGLRDHAELERRVGDTSAFPVHLLRSVWPPDASELDRLLGCTAFLHQLHADIAEGRLPISVLAALDETTSRARLLSLSEHLVSAAAMCVAAITELQNQFDSLEPGHGDRLSGDPIERLFTYVKDRVRAAREMAGTFLRIPVFGMSWREIAGTLADSDELRRFQTLLAGAENLLAEALGPNWHARGKNWSELIQIASWAAEFARQVRLEEHPAGLVTFFESGCSRDGIAQQGLDCLASIEDYIRKVELVHSKSGLGPADGFLADSLASQRSRVEAMSDHVDEIELLFRFNALSLECRKLGIDDVVRLAQEWPRAVDRLVTEFERAWCRLVVDQAMRDRTVLRDFDSGSHDAIVRSFRRLDKLLIEHNRARVARAHWQSVPRGEAGEMNLLRLQWNRQRGHQPIRRAMKDACSAIQAIKPVLLMSPLSVAMHLPSDGPLFDVVIYDEASQIKPEDALGSVVRARQMIVVGDSKQMPPTSFFDRLTGNDEADEEEEASAETRGLAQQESILALTSSRIPDASPCRRDLRWHYRSQHESLNQTSNRLFYKNRLVIFPSPEKPDDCSGVVFRHLPSTVYDRGASRKNVLEAKAVVEAAVEHVRSKPNLTLGIVAFSQAQAEAINDELDLAKRAEPAFGAFDTGRALDERLFVKNLERVQGDERDVILISIGYGFDENRHLTMNFGPVNPDGGERRLNVLITRARVSTVVFSNFTAEDMDLREVRSEGVKALHTFLDFAQRGRLGVPSSAATPEPSYFEDCVFERLRNAGYEVVKQVGSEGFFIDLAVLSPDRPGRYVLGIECDGRMYHSAKAARDRDRLRQEILEKRGWKILRSD
jgi:hypothetical protein